MNDIRDQAPGLRTLKWHIDWIRRPLVGIVLIAIVLAALFKGPNFFATLMVFTAVMASREWHRMVGAGRFLPEAIVTAATIVVALAFLLLWPTPQMAWIVLLGGTGISLILSGIRGTDAIWQSAGVLYLGIPALAMVSLHKLASNGAWVVIGVFLAVWATDTGALVVGKLIGGPRMAPILSPNKTWAGAFGGIVAASVVQAVYISILGGAIWPAALYGAGLSVMAHLGDLFESWTKRKFHLKDSGSLIPGHGGILDRIDSTLAAGSVAALLVLVLGLDPLFGARL